jgi:hypothetical protein
MTAASRTETGTSDSPLEKRLVDEGVLFPGTQVPLPAAELASRLAKPIAEHLERAAWWPDHDDRFSDRLGEYSSYSIGFKGRDFKTLYVGFESEPYCDAVLEITSSVDDPDLATSAPEAMKAALLQRDFKPGGGRGGFTRPQVVRSPEECRDAAEAIASLLTDCLGYDPAGRVHFKFETRCRTQPQPVLSALTLGDVGRLLRSEGLVIWPLQDPARPGFRTIDRPRFEVCPFYETSKGSGRYRALQLRFATKFEPEGGDAVRREVGRWFARGGLWTNDEGLVWILQTLVLSGGVTEDYLRHQVRAWRDFLGYVIKVGRSAEVEDDE